MNFVEYRFSTTQNRYYSDYEEFGAKEWLRNLIVAGGLGASALNPFTMNAGVMDNLKDAYTNAKIVAGNKVDDFLTDRAINKATKQAASEARAEKRAEALEEAEKAQLQKLKQKAADAVIEQKSEAESINDKPIKSDILSKALRTPSLYKDKLQNYYQDKASNAEKDANTAVDKWITDNAALESAYKNNIADKGLAADYFKNAKFGPSKAEEMAKDMMAFKSDDPDVIANYWGDRLEREGNERLAKYQAGINAEKEQEALEALKAKVAADQAKAQERQTNFENGVDNVANFVGNVRNNAVNAGSKILNALMGK